MRQVAALLGPSGGCRHPRSLRGKHGLCPSYFHPARTLPFAQSPPDLAKGPDHAHQMELPKGPPMWGSSNVLDYIQAHRPLSKVLCDLREWEWSSWSLSPPSDLLLPGVHSPSTPCPTPSPVSLHPLSCSILFLPLALVLPLIPSLVPPLVPSIPCPPPSLGPAPSFVSLHPLSCSIP